MKDIILCVLCIVFFLLLVACLVLPIVISIINDNPLYMLYTLSAGCPFLMIRLIAAIYD